MIALDLLLGTLSVALLVLPGALLARAKAIPQPLLAGFIIGALAWMWLVVVLDTFHVPLNRLTLGFAWTAVTAVALLLWRCRPLPVAAASTEAESRRWLLVLIPAIAVVSYRAIAQPLHGIDTIFRWDFLAHQLLQHGTLAFYPPATAGDFERYSWPDGIAPLVSSLYAASYALAGAARATLTAPWAILQFLLLIAVTHGLARSYFSGRAAAIACALLACSALVPWATGMGQETGLTAIALVAMLRYLPRANDPAPTLAPTVIAGLAAALGALAREYGLILIAIGLALCAARRLGPRQLAAFTLTALAFSLPWYARNWLRTGNPLFNLSVGGVFPTNEVHDWLNASYLAEFGLTQLSSTSAVLLLANAGFLLLAGFFGAALTRRAGLELTVIIGAWIALWLYSVGYTAAGFTYSLRVLNPALALCAVLGGAAFAQRFEAPRQRIVIASLLAVIATDASLRALTLPANSYRIPPAQWLTAGGAVHEYHARPIYREIVRVAAGEKILTLGPNALLTRLGAATVPLWSPDLRFLFQPDLPPAAVAQRLRAAGIGLIVLNRGSVNERFLAHSPFFREPGDTLRAVWSDSDMVVLRLNLAPTSATQR